MHFAQESGIYIQDNLRETGDLSEGYSSDDDLSWLGLLSFLGHIDVKGRDSSEICWRTTQQETVYTQTPHIYCVAACSANGAHSKPRLEKTLTSFSPLLANTEISHSNHHFQCFLV